MSGSTLFKIDKWCGRQPWFVRGLVEIGAALGLVSISAIVRSGIDVPILPYLFFVPAVGVSAFYFGRLSGFLATQFAAVLAIYLFLPPYHSFHLETSAQVVSAGLFDVIGVGIALVCASLRSSLLKQERDNETLEERIQLELGKRMKVEDALRQAQKMEAVGQLTGGLAHDFNNLLTGITGSLDLLESKLERGRTEGITRYIETAQSSARRAAALTHRLLAFSRRQTLEPRVADVCALVRGMDDMLGRTLGPAVRVEIVCEPSWPVLVDPGQLENALLNLCLNARDAMAEGGTILVTVQNRVLDHASAVDRGLDAGDYISLRVHDTGGGMAPETIERVFEPFFTTKPLGLGTGLGLSMVWGFAQQSGGNVKIHSSLGAGTRICLLLPRHIGVVSPVKVHAPRLARSAGGETVLIVDDEPAILMVARETLEDLGYACLTASDGIEGLKILQSDARIDMLVTDVGMPGLNGRQVADAARVLRPSLPVLFNHGLCRAIASSRRPARPRDAGFDQTVRDADARGTRPGDFRVGRARIHG